jgi:hypothetical protein
MSRIKNISLIFFILFQIKAVAQFSITPFVGINTTKMNTNNTYGTDYDNGGSFGFYGVEAEWSKNITKFPRIQFSLATGVSYLHNGFYNSTNSTFVGLGYTHSITNFENKYWQIPFIIRLNYQPFPLMEDLQIFVGGGVSNNILNKSYLTEEYTETRESNQALPPPPLTTTYEDSRDVTSLRKKNNLFQRFELGMKYKRLQVAFRISKSVKDIYCAGLETTWNVPDDKSYYIKTHFENGKTIEKYSEFVVGFRLLK